MKFLQESLSRAKEQPIPTDDLRIVATHSLNSPAELTTRYPLTRQHEALVLQSRSDIADILHGRSHRLLVVVGPCSIHDPASGLEYAQRLAEVAPRYSESLCIVMRVYFEKPRTTVGWKGLINDPDLDGSFQINKGMAQARDFLLQVVASGLPAATEFLDTTFGQYYADLVSLGAIGARTTESQVHRELASGLSMPVGFKNRTDGDVAIARDAILAASSSHSFPTLTKEGMPAIVETSGNPDCFLILRGGSAGPNYEEPDVLAARKILSSINPTPAIVVDCSHGNSNKDYSRQLLVAEEVCRQLRQGESPIRGVMMESHLKSGNQKLRDPKKLVYGQSITDACLGWEQTEAVLETLAAV